MKIVYSTFTSCEAKWNMSNWLNFDIFLSLTTQFHYYGNIFDTWRKRCDNILNTINLSHLAMNIAVKIRHLLTLSMILLFLVPWRWMWICLLLINAERIAKMKLWNMNKFRFLLRQYNFKMNLLNSRILRCFSLI